MFGKKTFDTKAPITTEAVLPPPPATTPADSANGVAASANGLLSPAATDAAKRVAADIKSGVFTETRTISLTDPRLITPDFSRAKQMLVENLLDKISFQALENLPKEVRRPRIGESIDTLINGINIPLTGQQTALLKEDLINEVLGFGPLEVLLSDGDVSDIMINTHKQVYIEKNGKLYLTDITFTSEKHLLDTVQKIVSLVGRRVDENSPMVDSRMPDGSRFNAIIPPLALDGSLVSIRKFKKNKMPLSKYVDYNSMSPEMCHFLEVCANIRLNIIISGGTGSGKTTLLNALSGHIDLGERVVTIEDAAELQMHQPHVLRLETRPANIEGTGEINQRQLVRNALRMRPDRIILGEIRGDEVLDVLSAMNTGHDGSMATIHANNPRDCLSRIENLISMSGITMPIGAMRMQISSAIHLIVQVARMRDGGRRVTHIEEIVGMEGDIIVTQTLFAFQAGPMDANGKLTGKYVCSGIRPRFFAQAQYFGREKEMLEALGLLTGGRR